MRNSGRVRRWLLVGLSILAALLLVKRYLADVRFVPSASMAPTLLPGDLVLIDKSIGSSGELRRYDVVMFERPQFGSQLLKRIVGLPGESIQLVGGDLFVGGKILSKSSSEFLRLAVPIFDSAEEPWEKSWEFRKDLVRPGEGGSLALSARPAASGGAGIFRKIPYLIRAGEKPISDAASFVARDAGMEIEFSAPPKGELQIVLGELGDLFHFRLGFASLALKASILRESIGPAEKQIQAELPPLAPGSRHVVEMGNVDNRLFLRLDGKEIFAPVPYDRNTPHRQIEAQEARAPTSAATLTFEGGELEVLRFRLLRDQDYLGFGGIGVDAPCSLGPAEYFLLGDNSGESEDSRSFGRVLRKEIRGKATRVVFPMSRNCSL